MIHVEPRTRSRRTAPGAGVVNTRNDVVGVRSARTTARRKRGSGWGRRRARRGRACRRGRRRRSPSPRTRRTAERGDSGAIEASAGSRMLCLTCTRSLCGNQWNSTWSSDAASRRTAPGSRPTAAGTPGPQHEGRHTLQGHGADHAEGAETDPGGAEQVGALVGGTGDDGAVGQHQLQRPDLGGQAAEAGAGAVGAGGDRAGNGLRVDVAEIGHGHAEPMQLGVQAVQRRAGPHGDQAFSRSARTMPDHSPGRWRRRRWRRCW